MPEPPPVSPILDYASPGLKKQLRLPSRSILTVRTGPAHLRVEEELAAKTGAVVAMGFAVFVLLWLPAPMYSVKAGLFVFGPFWLLELILLVRVAHDTWRKTILDVTPTGIRLTFRSPFRQQDHAWPAERVTSVTAFATETRPSPAVGFLDIRIVASPHVELFRGHEYDQLAFIATGAHHVLSATDADAGI